MSPVIGADAHAADTPKNTAADANVDVAYALAQTKAKHRPVLLIFGANWYKHYRSLDRAPKTEKNAGLIQKRFQVVMIDVGNFDHSPGITKCDDEPTKNGIPAAALVSPDDTILYSVGPASFPTRAASTTMASTGSSSRRSPAHRLAHANRRSASTKAGQRRPLSFCV